MPDPTYVIETAGKKVGLAFHLETAFYPPLPDPVRQAFMKAFTKYWEGEYDLEDQADDLRENAGYIGGLHQYNLYQFLNKEDLH